MPVTWDTLREMCAMASDCESRSHAALLTQFWRIFLLTLANRVTFIGEAIGLTLAKS